MTRTSHFSVDAHIPVYSVDFLSDDVVLYAGGGGAGRSGVTNAIVAAQISLPDQSITKLHQLNLSRDEDAPMTMAVNTQPKHILCGINTTAQQLTQGHNDHLRIYHWSLSEAEKQHAKQDDSGARSSEKENITELPTVKINSLNAAKSLDITDPEQYQKVTRFSPSGRMLAVASTDGKIALQRYPSLANVWKSSTSSSSSNNTNTNTNAGSPISDEAPNTTGIPSDDFRNDEIYDADFSEAGSHLVFTSSSKLVVYSTTPRPTPETPEGGSPRHSPQPDDSDSDSPPEAGYAQVIQTIKNPALGGKGPCFFRAARFGRGDASRERLFTVVNAAASGAAGRGAKAKIRKSFVTAWDADSWDLIETRHVSDRPVTVFDVSPDGKLLAYGSSDLSVGVLDARTLRPILKILHAHDFPPTSLHFNPSSSLLVSASADNTLRIIRIPPPDSAAKGGLQTLTETRGGVYVTILLAFIAVVAALILQGRLS